MSQNLPKATADALRFEEKILPNGLALRVLPMPGFQAVHAIYATNFGSVNRGFTQNGKTVELPAGIAHFLEHKMFESEDGTDAFSLYAETGASPNAYTGFDRTSYIFTATNEIDRNLDILLSFVGHPHFTAQTIAKEQGIIGQEIKMYEDNADTRAVFAMLAGLYKNHPVRDEIVGTVESIAEITPEMLYACCDAFYNPSNMALCAAGNITMQQLEAAVERAGLPKEKPAETIRNFPKEPEEVAKKQQEFTMPVSMPIFAMGFKETPLPAGADTTKTEVVCDLLTELLCGETSPLYRRLYDEGLVQPGFGADYGQHQGCLYMMFSGESEQPELVQQEILKEIERQRTEGIDAAQFETCKKMMYGAAISDLENVERVASLLSVSYFRGRTPAGELEAVANITLEDVQNGLATMLNPQKCSSVIVRPANE
ncbi:insulinase family protein [Ruminococcaceae bacterium OttesenSCG-928-A16]|nr:insulinase family protein [Ruminococcaceae bacterium OttesenSCG-928-A16]